MKNTLKESTTNKGAKAQVLLVGLLFACATILGPGCEESVRTTGAVKLTKSSDAKSVILEAYRIILGALADKDPSVRVNGIEVVAETGQARLMPKVQQLLGDEFVPVRFATALAVGDLEYSFGARSIEQLLRDEDSNVKIAASYAMIKLGHPEYREVLRRAIASSDQTLRANAAFLLGKSGDREALRLLYWALLNKDSEDKVVYQAAESIAMLGDDRIYPSLWTMLLSVYADVRVTGIRAMGALETPEARNALVTMLEDKVLEVRLVAAEQLGKLEDPIGEPEVLDVFEKKLTARMDKGARERACVLTALAIGRIRTPSLTKYLPKLLSDESQAVRLAAAKAVLQTGMKK